MCIYQTTATTRSTITKTQPAATITVAISQHGIFTTIETNNQERQHIGADRGHTVPTGGHPVQAVGPLCVQRAPCAVIGHPVQTWAPYDNTATLCQHRVPLVQTGGHSMPTGDTHQPISKGSIRVATATKTINTISTTTT